MHTDAHKTVVTSAHPDQLGLRLPCNAATTVSSFPKAI